MACFSSPFSTGSFVAPYSMGLDMAQRKDCLVWVVGVMGGEGGRVEGEEGDGDRIFIEYFIFL